jgi:hypothetical protein
MSTHHEHEELELIVISDEEQEYHSDNVVQGDNADDDDDGDDGDDGDDDGGDEAMLPRDSESESDDDGKYRLHAHGGSNSSGRG